jgi:hypothetical protein
MKVIRRFRAASLPAKRLLHDSPKTRGLVALFPVPMRTPDFSSRQVRLRWRE